MNTARSIVPAALLLAAATASLGQDSIEADLLALTPSQGRAPGSEAHAEVASYLRDRISELGLRAPSVGGYEQPIDVPLPTESGRPFLRFEPEGGEAITIPADRLKAHWSSGGGAFEGPASFTGYSIVTGPDGYMSFTQVSDLSDRLAVALKLEPMNDEGTSAWNEGMGWSFRANPLSKVTALARRNAAAVLLVTPPGAVSPQDAEPMVRLGDPLADFRFEIPVLELQADDADRILEAASGRSLDDLTRAANDQPEVIELEGWFTAGVETPPDPEPIANIAGEIPGWGDLADEIVLVAAHYDGPAESASANDNASGVAGLLDCAQLLAALMEDERGSAQGARTIVLLACASDSRQPLGLEAYLESLAPDDEDEPHPVAAALFLDAVGRSERGRLSVTSFDFGRGLRLWVAPMLDASFFEINTQSFRANPAAQISAAYSHEIPALHFTTGFDRVTGSAADTADSLDPEIISSAAELVGDIALELAMRPERFAVEDNSEDPGMRDPGTDRPVRLGVQPAFNSEEEGVLVQRVFEGTSADDAGLLPGDRIIKWDDAALGSVEDLGLNLSLSEPGSVVVFTVVREGEEMAIEVELKAAGD